MPSSQKSWIGKAYQIRDTIVGSYYYPTGQLPLLSSLCFGFKLVELAIFHSRAHRSDFPVLPSCLSSSEPHGLGETSTTSRPLKDGEVAEWILLDGVSRLWKIEGGKTQSSSRLLGPPPVVLPFFFYLLSDTCHMLKCCIVQLVPRGY